ncbi:MAG: acetylglutamate kinase [Alphaproteobacteria bacterium]|jgi:acetylglutamate kinase|nr:acetylglutamate kinase [Alphaproteobacteria bacterium]MBT4711632.1 acetylglutamate kinase [Alphaproteobacteria bacterium]MBT5860206.1 acetylglutamate kinase [Alphaproteobacteria bacterium]
MTAPKKKTRAEWLKTARTLAEALPYMRAFAGQTFVIKIGGHAMGKASLIHDFARDVMLIKQVGINPVVVHGGGPQIGKMLKKQGIESKFEHGLRITDKATVKIVERVLAGVINKDIVSAIEAAGGHAKGISGKKGGLVEARKLRRKVRVPGSNIEKILDLGFVGEPTQINADILAPIATTDMIPVIAPIGIGTNGQTYNINADTVAGAIAAEMGATKLVLMTDVEGVLDGKGKLVPQLSPTAARTLLRDGTITGGMIPKLETCLKAIKGGAAAAHILDGRLPHVLLLEIFTELGVGTMVRSRKRTT